MTKCPKCKFYSICGGRLNETVENCVRFKSVEQTNEEWLRSCTTEQLVSFLLWYPNNVHGYPKPKMSIAEEENAIREWLKQPHR